MARFTDDATMTSRAVSTHKVVSQAQPECRTMAVLGLLDYVRLTWVHVDTRYEYQWELRQVSTGAVARTGTVSTSNNPAAGSTITFDVSNTLISANGNFSFALRARLKGSTTWIAATETVTPVQGVGLGILGLAARCGNT